MQIFDSHEANMSGAGWNRRLDFLKFGVFNLILSVPGTWLKYPFSGELILFTNLASAIFAALDVGTEVMIYRELAFFNKETGSMVTARSILVFLYVITVYASLLLSCYTVFKEFADCLIIHVTCCVLFAVAISSMFVLNILVLTRN